MNKTSILSCNEDVTLRGIGDIQDELNLLTGELTQRIGEIVLDGSEGWHSFVIEQSGLGRMLLALECKSLVSDKVPVVSYGGSWNNTYECISKADNKNIILYLSGVSNANEFISKLNQNPITIQYPLATESVKTVDLNVVDQDGNTIPKIKSYNNVTHLEVSIPKQSLLPNVSAEVATDNSKDMSSLTTKHQEISEAQSTIEDNIQSQSDEIDTALMATTEIFESILE